MESTQKSNQEQTSLVKTDLGNGFLMVEFSGYTSYEDFMVIYDTFHELIQPDSIRYSVDSLCIMGSIVKDGVIIRMSNEGISDYVSMVYRKDTITEDGCDKAAQWAELVCRALPKA